MFFTYEGRKYNAGFIISISLNVEILKEYGEIQLDIPNNKRPRPVQGFSVVFPNFKLVIKNKVWTYKPSIYEYDAEIMQINALHEQLIRYTNYN